MTTIAYKEEGTIKVGGLLDGRDYVDGALPHGDGWRGL
jgi:hypothetical protein